MRARRNRQVGSEKSPVWTLDRPRRAFELKAGGSTCAQISRELDFHPTANSVNTFFSDIRTGRRHTNWRNELLAIIGELEVEDGTGQSPSDDEPCHSQIDDSIERLYREGIGKFTGRALAIIGCGLLVSSKPKTIASEIGCEAKQVQHFVSHIRHGQCRYCTIDDLKEVGWRFGGIVDESSSEPDDVEGDDTDGASELGLEPDRVLVDSDSFRVAESEGTRSESDDDTGGASDCGLEADQVFVHPDSVGVAGSGDASDCEAEPAPDAGAEAVVEGDRPPSPDCSSEEDSDGGVLSGLEIQDKFWLDPPAADFDHSGITLLDFDHDHASVLVETNGSSRAQRNPDRSEVVAKALGVSPRRMAWSASRREESQMFSPTFTLVGCSGQRGEGRAVCAGPGTRARSVLSGEMQGSSSDMEFKRMDQPEHGFHFVFGSDDQVGLFPDLPGASGG